MLIALAEKHWWLSFWAFYWLLAFIYIFGTAPGASKTAETLWAITKWAGGTLLFVTFVAGSYGFFF